MSLAKEAVDDYKRHIRDKELNSQLYEILVFPDDTFNLQLNARQLEEGILAEENVVASNVMPVKASDIQVGDILRLHTGQRVPADCLLLKTFNSEGTCFVRTDQLDGETDWKLKRSLGVTQTRSFRELIKSRGTIDIEAPRKDIYDFVATCTVEEMPPDDYMHISGSGGRESEVATIRESLNVENALWTNVIMTSGPVLALVIFTGDNTRAAKHRGKPVSKLSAFDHDVNRTSKILCSILCIAAVFLTLGKPLNPLSGIYFMRFVLLLSSIIPISLRVNFDMAKLVYSYIINRDKDIPGTLVRNTNLPEELGRIDLLVSDKTGTLTQNCMKLQSIVCSNKQYNVENVDSLRRVLPTNAPNPFMTVNPTTDQADLLNMIFCMALCHCVIPAYDHDRKCPIFEASSPDEMAMVQWCSDAGFKLISRDTKYIKLRTPPGDNLITCEILETFTFSSSRKRMGIIVRDLATGSIFYFLKGAEVALLKSLKTRPQWLIEELDNLSTLGLRTLVYSWKVLSEEEYRSFQLNYDKAKNSLVGRIQKCHDVIDTMLESDMNLLGLTGVEDELQVNVADTVESLIQAGIRIWMLTGDKVDTALCIATSAGLKGRMDVFVKITSDNCSTSADVALRLRRLGEGHYVSNAGHVHGSANSLLGVYSGDITRRPHELLNIVVCIDAFVVSILLEDRELAALFVAATARCKSVLCCRCSPSQKAQIVGMLKRTKMRIAAVGDGGNDVPMIQAAHCGIGILGKEGRQASLAADFSLTEFRYLKRLILWHGRLAQLRSTKLSAFIIHRGLVISIIQIFFSSVFYFTPLALFQGWLQVGYSTYYTMLPVFSLVFDRDVPPHVCFLFPEIYRANDDQRILTELMFGRILFMSIFQGCAIMIGALLLFDEQLINFVAIAFTALVLLELLNVVSDVLTWHRAMVIAELFSVVLYLLSLVMLPEYFNLEFVFTSTFWYKVSAITVIAWLPVHCYNALKKLINPPQYTKLVS